MEESNNFSSEERFRNKSIERRPFITAEHASSNDARFYNFQTIPSQYYIPSNPVNNSNFFNNYQVYSRELVPYQTSFSILNPPASLRDVCLTENNFGVQYTENFIGNYASDESCTYSQFGTSLNGLKFTSLENLVKRNVPSKTKITTDTRSKRPSYLDVLTKSVSHNSFEINQKPHGIQENIKQNNFSKKNLNTKPSSYTPQLLYGKKKNNQKTIKEHFVFTNDTRKKNINLKDEKNKKNNIFNDEKKKTYISKVVKPKTFSNDNSIKKEKTSNQKRASQKKNFEEKTSITKSKYETTRINKTYEDKKISWNDQKLSKKNNRNFQSEKPEKFLRKNRREPNSCISIVIKIQVKRLGRLVFLALNWLFWLVFDVLLLTTYLALYTCTSAWSYFVNNLKHFLHSITNIQFMRKLKGLKFFFRKSHLKKLWLGDVMNHLGDEMPPMGLKQNISLSQTVVETIQRILACDGKDAYSVLGVTYDCSDDNIKKYYKWQKFLINSKKNELKGAEEAIQLLIRAFSIIGHPDQRKSYDRLPQRIYLGDHYTDTEGEMSWLRKIKRKSNEFLDSYIWCSNCKKHHKKTMVKRPLYAARMCSQCKIHHSVREGDIWAETSMFGLLRRYYACMEGKVYDVSDWAGCQRKNFKDFKANTHNVQTKLVKNLILVLTLERLDT